MAKNGGRKSDGRRKIKERKKGRKSDGRRKIKERKKGRKKKKDKR